VVVSVLVTLGAAFAILVFDVRLAGRSWLAVVLTVLALSLLTGLVWWVRRVRGAER